MWAWKDIVGRIIGVSILDSIDRSTTTVIECFMPGTVVNTLQEFIHP